MYTGQVLTLQTKRTIQVTYNSAVRDCRRSLCVLPPQERAGQVVLHEEWVCEPPADTSDTVNDDFGNRFLHLSHKVIEQTFSLDLELETSHADVPVEKSVGMPPNGIGAFLLPSALCDWTREIEGIGQKLSAKLADMEDKAEAFCNFAFERVEYAPGTTRTETRASQTLENRRGVCQDHAHLMISLCRAAKIPARYVSGYLPGEGAMHAWAEVLIDDCWIGFDPTHNRRVRPDYVFVACGRDFRDCASITGSYRGRAQARLTSHCKTEILSP